jgi:hypothetical protein
MATTKRIPGNSSSCKLSRGRVQFATASLMSNFMHTKAAIKDTPTTIATSRRAEFLRLRSSEVPVLTATA